ncbi:YqjK family protein [Ramlibacter humi]|uniref:YqjK-like protein n=1 Tax=Ramlibacter humi TaxID=2530451 RepID=A0A4Z0BFK6_9BURK|nr:YqjK family protein [Ramlibacter humi]TFY97600.1 hypothetical protein EZ216_17885 [Ramlibacter humi]
MARGFEAIAERRAQLLVRSSYLRAGFASDAKALQAPFAAADRVRDAVHWCRERPYVFGIAAAGAALLRPRRVLSLGWRVWGGWRMWRQIRAALRP